MDFKDFTETKEVLIECYASIDGEPIAKITGYTTDSVVEQMHKLDSAISKQLTAEFEDLPETEQL